MVVTAVKKQKEKKKEITAFLDGGTAARIKQIAANKPDPFSAAKPLDDLREQRSLFKPRPDLNQSTASAYSQASGGGNKGMRSIKITVERLEGKRTPAQTWETDEETRMTPEPSARRPLHTEVPTDQGAWDYSQLQGYGAAGYG